MADRDVLLPALRDGTHFYWFGPGNPMLQVNRPIPLPADTIENAAIALLTSRPAALMGIDAGRIAKGAAADLCLFHPDRIWQVKDGALPGKAQNTPFDGRALEGVVLGTWKRGKRVFG